MSKAEISKELQDGLIHVGSLIKDHPEVAESLGLESKRWNSASTQNPVDRVVENAMKVFLNNGRSASSRYQPLSDGVDRDRLSIFDLQKKIEKTVKAGKESKIGNVKDNFNRVDHSILMQRVITNFVEMPLEPPAALVSLFRNVTIEGLWGANRIEFPAFGAMEAEELGPTSEYPEQDISADAKTFAKWGKKGLAVRFPEEFIANSQYDIIRIHLELAGNALRRLKENLAAQEILKNSGTVLDNRGSFALAGSATSGTWTTSGNGADGSLNGTITLNDLFLMYSEVIQEGFFPDCLMMHPLGWIVWAQNPELRALAFQNGGGNYFQAPEGNIGRYTANERGGLNLGLNGVDQGKLSTLYTNIPNMFPTPFRIISSPFLEYTDDARNVPGTPAYPVPTVDMIMADSAQVGYIIDNGEGVTTESWRNFSNDMEKTKFREYYGFLLPNQGAAMKRARGIKVTERGFDFEDRLRFTVAQAPAAAATELGSQYNP